jgi:hypothetical protein
MGPFLMRQGEATERLNIEYRLTNNEIRRKKKNGLIGLALPSIFVNWCSVFDIQKNDLRQRKAELMFSGL